jgi:hypothetical protein
LIDTVTYLFHEITPVKLKQNLIKFDVDSLITGFLVEKCSPANNVMRGASDDPTARYEPHSP